MGVRYCLYVFAGPDLPTGDIGGCLGRPSEGQSFFSEDYTDKCYRRNMCAGEGAWWRRLVIHPVDMCVTILLTVRVVPYSTRLAVI